MPVSKEADTFKDLAAGRVVREYRAGKRRETLAALSQFAREALAALSLAALFFASVWLAHLAANAF
jgi:hypothetical protein